MTGMAVYNQLPHMANPHITASHFAGVSGDAFANTYIPEAVSQEDLYLQMQQAEQERRHMMDTGAMATAKTVGGIGASLGTHHVRSTVTKAAGDQAFKVAARKFGEEATKAAVVKHGAKAVVGGMAGGITTAASALGTANEINDKLVAMAIDLMPLIAIDKNLSPEQVQQIYADDKGIAAKELLYEYAGKKGNGMITNTIRKIEAEQGKSLVKSGVEVSATAAAGLATGGLGAIGTSVGVSMAMDKLLGATTPYDKVNELKAKMQEVGQVSTADVLDVFMTADPHLKDAIEAYGRQPLKDMSPEMKHHVLTTHMAPLAEAFEELANRVNAGMPPTYLMTLDIEALRKDGVNAVHASLDGGAPSPIVQAGSLEHAFMSELRQRGMAPHQAALLAERSAAEQQMVGATL